MLSTFNKEEKMLLIAVLKFIAQADGKLEEGELETFHKVAEEKGFEDFREIFNEVDETVHSLNDLSHLVNSAEDSEHKKDIIRYAVEMSRSDRVMKYEDSEAIRYLARAWGLDIKDILYGNAD